MTKLDDDLRARLSTADEEFLADLESGRGFFTQLWATFKGPQGWIGVSVLFVAFICLGLAIWFGWEAFHAQTDRETTLWAAGAILGILGNALLRMFHMNRMQTLTVLRELKRVELRLIKLDERVG